MSDIVYKIKIIVGKLVIFSLYAVFYFVQVTTSSVFSPNNRPDIISPKTDILFKAKALTGKLEDVSKRNIRLNKRFHPESITSLLYTVESPAPIFPGKFTLCKPEDYLLISSIIRDSLRGPPVVS